jgi:hypothetical protein
MIVRAQTVSVTFHGFSPMVLSSASPAHVLYTAEFAGTPTRVTLDFSPGGTIVATTFELRDDGTEGDRTPGDRIYSVLLPSAPLLAAIRPDDVHRLFVGFLNVFSGSAAGPRGNVFVDVMADDVPGYPVVQLSPTAQATSRLVNIHDASYFSANDIARITREFYRWFGDDYDFFNIISAPNRFHNRTHFQVRNDVDGIGLARFNNTAQYGSAGRLLGISQFPIPTFFDDSRRLGL